MTGALPCPAGSQLDCDDFDPFVFPGATEFADSIDKDCDGQIDEEATPGLVPDLRITDDPVAKTILSWSPAPAASFYEVYRGTFSPIAAGAPYDHAPITLRSRRPVHERFRPRRRW